MMQLAGDRADEAEGLISRITSLAGRPHKHCRQRPLRRAAGVVNCALVPVPSHNLAIPIWPAKVLTTQFVPTGVIFRMV